MPTDNPSGRIPTPGWQWPQGTPRVGPPLGCAVCKRPICDHAFAELGRLASIAQRAERDRDELLAAICTWLEDHAAGRKADFYAPSKSGPAALDNAVKWLRTNDGPDLIARIKAGK